MSVNSLDWSAPLRLLSEKYRSLCSSVCRHSLIVLIWAKNSQNISLIEVNDASKFSPNAHRSSLRSRRLVHSKAFQSSYAAMKVGLGSWRIVSKRVRLRICSSIFYLDSFGWREFLSSDSCVVFFIVSRKEDTRQHTHLVHVGVIFVAVEVTERPLYLGGARTICGISH